MKSDCVKAKKKVEEKAIKMMKDGYVCNHCLGRGFAELLSGMTNEDRGRIIRHYIAFLVDSGEKVDVDNSNFHEIKFRNVKLKITKPKKCRICENFFLEKIDELTKKIEKKLEDYTFDTFLIGTILSDELAKAEDKLWKETGIEFVEPIKSEINRELGKRVERLTKKNFSLDNPDITIIVDIGQDHIRLQMKSLFFYGKYQKLVRGIPQTRWNCNKCGGKGCIYCKGEGKLYRTSVQEIVEKPFIKAVKARKSKFHGAGREDIDARCLGKRPFIIELLRPRIRDVNIKKIQAKINKSKKVKVRELKIATKKDVQEIKRSRYDKTYLAEVVFLKKIDKEKLKLLKTLESSAIKQQTPSRVSHRRANLIRTRKVKKISTKLINEKKIEFKIRGEAGLYIKELLTGDSGGTKPNISVMLGNKVKSIKLDVIKIHTK